MPKRHAPPYRGVILGHERYGLVQHTLDLVAKFASYGYLAIAPDMTHHWDGDKKALEEGKTSLTINHQQIAGPRIAARGFLIPFVGVLGSDLLGWLVRWGPRQRP